MVSKVVLSRRNRSMANSIIRLRDQCRSPVGEKTLGHLSHLLRTAIPSLPKYPLRHDCNSAAVANANAAARCRHGRPEPNRMARPSPSALHGVTSSTRRRWPHLAHVQAFSTGFLTVSTRYYHHDTSHGLTSIDYEWNTHRKRTKIPETLENGG